MDHIEWPPALELAPELAGAGVAPRAIAATALGKERQRLEMHDSALGTWLRSSDLELFVAVEPTFRVLSLRRPGGRSLLADGTLAQSGLRLAFMEPGQVPASFEVGNQPATLLQSTMRNARVRLEATQGLCYSVSLTLEDRGPRLRLEYSLENVGKIARRVACWSVLSFARRGLVVVPSEGVRHEPKRLLMPDWAAWPQPAVQIGHDAVATAMGGMLNGLAYKVGVVSSAGWIAFQRDGEALHSSATFDPEADYPEGGANITFFEADDGANGGWCEIEHVGPLQHLACGHAIHLSQTVELLDGIPSGLVDPDALCLAIESRLPKKRH